MFTLFASILFLISISGLAISLFRVSEQVLKNTQISEWQVILERLSTFEWVSKLPHDELLLIAVFLIASALSLRAIGDSKPRVKTPAKSNWQV